MLFGLNNKPKNQRPQSGGIFRSFNSQQKAHMETHTTATSCLNIDVKAFNQNGRVISARKTSEIFLAKKNYAVIKKTAMQ
jgi:hypothetical protein